MNRRSLMPVLALAAAIAVSGCASSSNAANSSGSSASGTKAESASGASQEKGSLENVKKSMTEEKRGEFKAPDLYGKVKSVVGNEVSIALAEKPKRPANTGANNNNNNVQNSQQGGSGFGAPSASGQSGSIGSGGESSKRPSIKRTLKLTGETKTVILPVGIKIEKMARGGGESLDISDIKEGDVISIFYVDSDASKGLIESVSIRSGGTSQNGQSN